MGIATAASVGIPVALSAVFFTWPVGAMLARGLASRALETLGSPRAWGLVAMALRMAAAGMLGSMIFGIPGAYALCVRRFPRQRALRAVASVPLILLTVIVGVAFRSLLGKDGAYSFLEFDGTGTTVVAVMASFNFSVVVRTVGTTWAGLDSHSMDVVRMLDAGPIRVFRTVALPTVTLAVAGAVSLIFLFCSTAYGIVMTLGGVSTLESEIWARINRLGFDVAAGLSLVQFVIVALALIVSSQFSRSAALYMTRRKRRLRLVDAPVVALIAVVVLALILTPMALLITRSFVHADTWSLENYRQLATSGSGFTGGMTMTEALDNSLHAATYATLIALAVDVPLVFMLLRPTRARWARLGQFLAKILTMAPLGVSSMTIGLGFLILFQGPPLELGSEAVPFAQAIVVAPMTLHAPLPVLRAIDPRSRGTVATLSADPAHILRTVGLPLVAKGLMLAADFALAINLDKFSASSFLVSGGDDTLPALISRLLNRPDAANYGMALAASVILELLATLVMFLYELPAESDARMPIAKKAAEVALAEKRSAESKVEESKTMARIEELK